MAMKKPRLNRIRLPRDPLFRLLAINGMAGLGVAALVLGGIFFGNIGNLRVLVMTTEEPFLPVLMLAFGLFITLGSVVMGSAIMLLGEGGQSDGSPRRIRLRAARGALQPLPVRAGTQRRNDLHR
ncbi:hypothetical protein [Roseibium sp. M-1]